MKIPVKLLLTKNVAGIHYDCYIEPLIYEGECILYINKYQNVPKEIIICFKRGYSQYAMLYDLDTTSPPIYNPKFKG